MPIEGPERLNDVTCLCMSSWTAGVTRGMSSTFGDIPLRLCLDRCSEELGSLDAIDLLHGCPRASK